MNVKMKSLLGIKVILVFMIMTFAEGIGLAQIPENADWANFGRYAEANKEVNHHPLAVIMGDSITDLWYDMNPDFFKNNDIIGRGISGQTTSQMLVRFRKDVLAHYPKYVLILAGTNDIARNTGKIELDDIAGNIISMCEIAKVNNIEPIIVSILPSKQYGWRPHVENVAEDITKVNQMLKTYAKNQNVKYLDLHEVLKDAEGGLPKEYSNDGVHPTMNGYMVIEPLVLKVLK